MDFFQRVGNFFQGKGWVSDDDAVERITEEMHEYSRRKGYK